MLEIDIHTPDTQHQKSRRLYKPRKKLSQETIDTMTEGNRGRAKPNHIWHKKNRLLERKRKERKVDK